jgi:N-acetylglucosaminyl-diphospho-decaprenol L-rhamnosyltransferase
MEQSPHPETRTLHMPPKVSFVTVCYKTPDLVRLLLRGVERAGFSFPFEYFLVDNGRDGTADMVRERYPWVRIIEPDENVGFARGNNLALGQAAGEYAMLVNPDLAVFAGEMEKLLAYADANPDAGVFGPLLENPNGSRQETCTRFPTLLTPAYKRTFLGRTQCGKRALARYDMEDVSHDEPHDAAAVYGAAILIRRVMLERIGFLDQRFFMYYEDVDFCRRAWKEGWRVLYAPVARFVHYHQRESMITSPAEILTNRLTRIHIASGIRYFLKYRGEALPREE